MRTKAQRAKAAAVAGVVWLAAGNPAQAQTTSVAAAAPADSAPLRPLAVLCDAPWFRSGSRVQMEGDGAMPMSVTMTLRRTTKSPTGCRAQLEVRSKSALSALMGPPVIMNQVHMVNIDRRSATARSSIESEHAVINAQGRYARMYGEAAFRGQGVFSYAGMDIHEGSTIEGEAFESSVSLQIFPLGADEVVGSMRALYASISVSSRHVGKRQMIDTVLGRKECMPITYEKRTSLGPLMVGEEVVQVEPTVMHVTDWYCPAEAFVLRTEIRQQDKVQRIDVTAMELDTTAPDVPPTR
ncbi:hypothetical protein [Cupriavidus sp. 2MCAB6]|uniref:hypothetical protein n=1 Tax=Cupriavidus sp. 2MCAB6 TaxID=3232981 RepID=UPI003F934FE0